MKLLLLLLLGNLALKLPGVLSVGELASTGPLGKEPLGKKIRFHKKLCGLTLALAIPYGDSSTYRKDGLIHLPAKRACKGETYGFESPTLATKECTSGHK